jgi:hypothetical protein
MGTRKQREKQEEIWIAHQELASAPGHPFYQRLNELLEAGKFDEFVEGPRPISFPAFRGVRNFSNRCELHVGGPVDAVPPITAPR